MCVKTLNDIHFEMDGVFIFVLFLLFKIQAKTLDDKIIQLNIIVLRNSKKDL